MLVRPCAAAALGILVVPTVTFAQTLTDPALSRSSHFTGLSQPTGFAFLGSNANELFAIEKATGIVKYKNGATISNALDLSVVSNSERGLLGIALPPTFSTDTTKYVYLYYSRTSDPNDNTVNSTWLGNRLSRWVWNGTNLSSEQVLLDFNFDAAQNNGANHDAGPVTFGPDGKLYGTTGDLNRDRAEQNNQAQPGTSASVGGYYRINPDGTLPADNPFIANPNPDFRKWYAYGIRNTFGIAFDPVTNALWDTENGPGPVGAYDEVNRVDSGFNSGWNEIMGPDSRDPQGVGNLVQFPNSQYSDPEFSWEQAVAPTGLAFLAAISTDPAYENLLIVGDNNNGRLYKFTLNGSRTGFVLSGSLADLVADTDEANPGNSDSQTPIIWGTGWGVVTQIGAGPDGALYVTSLSQGTIHRISGIPIPEPASLALIGSAMLLLARRRADD